MIFIVSLTIINCGVDSTKPEDLAGKLTEIGSGTGIATNISLSSGTVDVTSFIKAGQTVTSITEVVQTGGTSVSVSGTSKNNSGGIYQFTVSPISGATATVTYRYTEKKLSSSSKGTLTTNINPTTNVITFKRDGAFWYSVYSVTNSQGNDIPYNRTLGETNGTVTLTLSNAFTGTLNIDYTYSSIYTIALASQTGTVATGTNAIPLTAANDAGKTYILSNSSGVSAGIVSTNASITSVEGEYRLWLY